MQINPICFCVSTAHDPRNLVFLPVDDANQNQRQTAATVHLLPQLPGVDSASSAIEHVTGESVELLDLEQTPSDPSPQFRLGHVLKDVFGLEDAAQIAIGPIKAVGGSRAGAPV